MLRRSTVCGIYDTVSLKLAMTLVRSKTPDRFAAAKTGSKLGWHVEREKP
jgi:hypothetical protein